MPLSWLWSPSLLLNRSFLWLLFIVNALGTIYGYIWYGDQLADTLNTHPLWRIVFVPDSPTASLFFTLYLLFLIFPNRSANPSRLYRVVRMAVEAFAVLTLLKYGIWAVAMNAAQGLQGDPLDWQNWMLIVSHASMAIEGLLYVRFMIFGRAAALLVLGWLLLNDTMDYGYGVYPWLPRVLSDDLATIETFTIGLSIASYLAASVALTIKRITAVQRS
jgi:uncharacterized membrane protein YpjA